MLTDKDIDKILSVVASKEDIRFITEKLESIEDTQKRTFEALDRLATTIEKLNLEYAAISEQISRHEKWIKQIAEKAGVSLRD